MKKAITALLCLAFLCSLLPVSRAQEEQSFVLAAMSANTVIIEPERISYTPGQTVRQALLASTHSFTGLEQGLVYEIDGVSASFLLFYDNNGYDLDAPAQSITALCFGVNSQYSPALLSLVRRMEDYRQMGNVQQYAPAQDAYVLALDILRGGDETAAQEALARLNAAIDAYESSLAGEKYTLTVAATQSDALLAAPHVTLTDAYGNVTETTGTQLAAVAGEYQFCVSDGGRNRTEGSLTLSGDATLSLTLPDGEWFGAVRLLNKSKEPYAAVSDSQTHSSVYRLPDTAKELSSVYLNVGMGSVPDRSATKLRAIYTGTDGRDYSTRNRSWESTATVLTYLVKPGMEGRSFHLEARYTGADGFVQIQSYGMSIERFPTLAALSVSAEGTQLPLNFAPDTFDYDLTTVSQTLTVTAQPLDESYTLTGTGEVTAADEHTVCVSAAGVTTSYRLHISRQEAACVSLDVPQGVTATVENELGSILSPVDGVYHLIPGQTYLWRSTLGTYYHASSSFVASDGLTLSVATPVVKDGLRELALYDGSNATTRVRYEADAAFAPEQHAYVFHISDCNTALYMQATAERTPLALYATQTTTALTHGDDRNVAISSPVDAQGGVTYLGQVLARSGQSNRLTVRLSFEEAGVTYYEDYTLLFARALHLTALSAADASGAVSLLDEAGSPCAFDREQESYRIRVKRTQESLTLSAEFPNPSGETDCCGSYFLLLNGVRVEDSASVPLLLDTDKASERIVLEVCHADESAARKSYVLQIDKSDPVALTLLTQPADAIVCLTDTLTGRRVLPEAGVYPLDPGSSYSYTVTRAGFIGQQGSLSASEAPRSLTISLTEAPENTSLVNLPAQWPHLRQNSNNNGVISSPTPIRAEEAVLYWATKVGDGYDKNACGCPILVDGYLYTYAGTTIYKVDTLSGEIVATGQMERASSFAINPPTYAAGMLFIGLADGTIQAFNAATLQSLWVYHDPLGGQSNSSIVYHEGYVYTGFWVGETSEAAFVCLSATDEDPAAEKEEKLASWRFTRAGGFYWAGAYVCGDYLLLGTDDGASGYTTGHASLLSLDPLSGRMLSQWELEVPGDIRSSITAADGKFYFTNKGGYFFEAGVRADGTITALRVLPLTNDAGDAARPPMSTCTPTVYHGRAYIGVSGTSQFGAYSGHNLTVIDLANWEIAYTVPTQGYPQTSGVLTTAYEVQTGCVYVYFFDNFTPGKLRVLEDRPGQTRPSLTSTEHYLLQGTEQTLETAYALFTPSGEQAQYAICSPIMDDTGTIYFKNDSGYLMAVGSTIDRLELASPPEKTDYRAGECFDATGLRVLAHYTNGVVRDVSACLSYSTQPLSTQDEDFGLTMPHVLYQNVDGASGVSCPAPFLSIRLSISDARGDADGNGAVDMADVALVLRWQAGLDALPEAALTTADLNGDGSVDEADVALLVRLLNGEVITFPQTGEAAK